MRSNPPNPHLREYSQGSPGRTIVILISLAITLAINLITGTVNAGESARRSTPKHFGAGIDVRTQPRVEETGLPLYPGATVEHSQRDEKGREALNDGVNFDLWFGGFGLKLVVVKLKTSDSAEKVSAFYRDALTRYGEILDCSNESIATRRSETPKVGTKSGKPTCDDLHTNEAKNGEGEFYKSGVKQKQYGVAIQAKGAGTTFQLFHFEKRGGDD